MKYYVVVHYEGDWRFEVEAENKNKAKEIAETEFEKLSDSELITNLADIFIDGCWEA